jgi:hypothetical protein
MAWHWQVSGTPRPHFKYHLRCSLAPRTSAPVGGEPLAPMHAVSAGTGWRY